MPKDAKGRRKGKGIAAAGRKGPTPALIGGLVVVVLFAAVVGFGIYRSQQSASGTDAALPTGATAAGLTIGNAAAPATIDIYLDFQCPICKAYEAQSGATIDSMVAAGKAKVVYHPVAFLDSKSSTQYSTRASAASGCAATAGVFPQFLKLLYANQPPENAAGLPDEQLVSLAEQAGAPAGSIEQCISNGTYKPWTAGVTDAASKAGVNGTPTVLVNGKEIDNTDAALRTAVG